MVNDSVRRKLSLTLPSKTIPIYIGENLLQDAELFKQFITSQQVLIVTNNTIAPLYLNALEENLTGFQVEHVILQDGEAYKNQESLFAIYNVLISSAHHPDTTIIALGGGVIGDIAGFAAATYKRGVSLIQVPTTLLAQIDASVGGKTAINYKQAKNSIGCFYQPNLVAVDLTTLSSLSEREFRAGLGELIKYGLLVGGEVLESIYQALKQGLSTKNQAVLGKLIEACCRIKAGFVEEDERETGRRALLNLGHTFGHALEAESNYERWLHGEAVGIGLYCAALLSYQRGHLDKRALELIDELLQLAALPCRIPKSIDVQKLHILMLHDKKIKNGALRFVLLRALGDCYVETQVTADELHRVLLGAKDE